MNTGSSPGSRTVYYETTAFVNIHPLPYEDIISYDQLTPLPVSDTRLFCDHDGLTISRLNGIWEVTEQNDNLGGYIELGSSAPPMPADFHGLSVLWNLHHDGAQGDVDVSCECELTEGWESGWEGDSPWIESEIEQEEKSGARAPGRSPEPCRHADGEERNEQATRSRRR